jgi:predicted acyltransferase
MHPNTETVPETSPDQPQKGSSPQPTSSQRVLAIDALRGFDMFWIIGADTFFVAALGLSTAPLAKTLSHHLEHVPWEGFVFYDLIFPLFLFIVGCAIPFSLEKYRENPSAVWGRIARRTALLIVMGLIYNRIQDFQWSEMRWMGVLQRIGICYGIASVLFLKLSPRVLAIVLLAILLGYWGILAWVPVPGGTAGDWSPEGNLAGYLDRTLLPGKIYKEYYGFGDNEGILSTMPAVATAILGIFAGVWLKSPRNPWLQVLGLAASGAILLGVGIAWGQIFPIIKNLWTSSFVLVAGGWSLILLSVFYLLIDVLRWRWWAWFWIVIGSNAITIYMLQDIVPFETIAEYFLKGTAQLIGDWGPMLLAAGALALKWLLLLALYRQKIFLRL